MYYLRARYYNPAIGTFVSRDPYAGTAARAMSLNGYSWVEGRVVNAVDPAGLIVLTFDDGPILPNDIQILDILAAQDARATFFFHGNNIDPLNDSIGEVIWRVVTEGHRIGNHSFEHTNLSELCLGEVVQSINRTENNIKSILERYRREKSEYQNLPGHIKDYISLIIRYGTGLFRPPGGDLTPHQQVLLEPDQINCPNYMVGSPTCDGLQGVYNVLYWDVDPADWQVALNPSNYGNPLFTDSFVTPTNLADYNAAQEIYRRIFDGYWRSFLLPVGSISVWKSGVTSNSDNILLHSTSNPTVIALPWIVNKAKRRGYTFDVPNPGYCIECSI
jgi:peptidoglycan/xylan/chitin deacetylase (PgdA/CDA1 family)